MPPSETWPGKPPLPLDELPELLEELPELPEPELPEAVPPSQL